MLRKISAVFRPSPDGTTNTTGYAMARKFVGLLVERSSRPDVPLDEFPAIFGDTLDKYFRPRFAEGNQLREAMLKATNLDIQVEHVPAHGRFNGIVYVHVDLYTEPDQSVVTCMDVTFRDDWVIGSCSVGFSSKR